MRKLLLYLLFINTALFSVCQELRVIKAKKVFLNGEKIKKGDVLTDEIVTFNLWGRIILENKDGIQTTHNEYGEKRIDTLHNYVIKWKPISDSINSIIDCDMPIVGVPGYTGPGHACTFLYQIDFETGNGELHNLAKVQLEWSPVRNIQDKTISTETKYYVVISDGKGLNLKLFETPNTQIEMDLSEFENHYDLMCAIISIEPCGTSFEEFSILNSSHY